MSTQPTLPAAHFVAALERAGVTHVIGIPDNRSAPLFDVLADHKAIHLVTASREGEAFAVAAGVWLGKGSPVVIVQNTGLLEGGDALRGTASRMGVPLPIIITARGYEKMGRAGLSPASGLGPELVTRADVDSVALHTEPTLHAWGIPFTRAESEVDFDALDAVITRARTEQRPVAWVLAQRLA